MGTDQPTLNIVCVRVGEKYARDYVAILHDAVTRNLNRPFRFWCITDDERPIHPEIGIIPADPELKGWWQKVRLFEHAMPWKLGERVVYFDLDVAIVGRLEELAETPGIIRDWNLPSYNSSVMVWDHGDHPRIWEDFTAGAMAELPGDQDWITALDQTHGETMLSGGYNGGPQWDILPRDWCLSYRAHAQDWPPVGAKVIVFHGSPKPCEVTTGWVPDVWKIGGLTELPAVTGMNVSFDHALENVRLNSARDLPWFVGSAPHKEVAVIVAGGPSLKTSIDQIRAHKQRGAKIIALNNACAYLNLHGIVPDALMVCDARPENVVFVRADAKRYIIASQCDPTLFDELAARGCDTHLIQLAICDEMQDLMKPYEETKPICLVGGGSTVALRASFMLILSGYCKHHYYGLDGSYSGSEHHAYEQRQNDTDNATEVFVPALQKHYVIAPWMGRQAAEWRDITWPTLKQNGVKVWVHGSGLIPDMTKVLQRG